MRRGREFRAWRVGTTHPLPHIPLHYPSSKLISMQSCDADAILMFRRMAISVQAKPRQGEARRGEAKRVLVPQQVLTKRVPGPSDSVPLAGATSSCRHVLAAYLHYSIHRWTPQLDVPFTDACCCLTPTPSRPHGSSRGGGASSNT